MCEVLTEDREGGGEGVEGQELVVDGPVGGVEDIHLTTALAIEGAFPGQLQCLWRQLQGKHTSIVY